MTSRTAAEHTRSDLAHLIHPLYHPSDHQEPKIWAEASGAVMRDVNGDEFIDGLSGLWNINVGHGRRELAEAAMQQMQTLAYCSSYTGASNLPAIELAERLSGLAYPSINTFFFNQRRRRIHGELVQDGALLLEGAGQAGQGQDHFAPSGLPRRHHGRHERHRHPGLLAHVRAPGAQFRARRLAVSVSLRGRRRQHQPRRGGGQSVWKRPSCARGRIRWRRSSPSRCRVLAASSCRRRITSRASATFATRTTCC